ncbi:MAG TPA: FAD-dependent oxidoreductase [Candidatus Saccharimonadales bacterium]
MPDPEKHDLIVIGGGPAGLSAAITAETERVDTVVIDNSHTLGGQAGTTSLIENYPGFPNGITGPELMARIVDQALRFSTKIWGPSRADTIEPVDEGILVRTDDGDEYLGNVALLSTGVDLKQLKANRVAAYRGRGVNYGPPPTSANYQGKTMVVIGGANSAGQAAVNLSEFAACEVHMLVRGDSIEDKMSGYLIDKIAEKKNITVHTRTELTGVDGDGRLSEVSIEHRDNGSATMKADEVFVFIGAIPKTTWLPPDIVLDPMKFVVAGGDLSADAREAFVERTKGRAPYAHETSMPRLFVAGDVRCGTNKRVALAAGDGAGVIPEVHNLRAYKPRTRARRAKAT